MKRALLLLAACGGAKPAPVPPPLPTPTPTHAEAPPADAPAPKQEEVLAAIQKAMNDLAPAANACWAKAATERFDIEGEYVATIDIGASAQIVDQSTHTLPAAISECMRAVLAKYPWAPPLHGQTIQLPFKWSAPQGQSVLDRQLVDAHAQAGISVSVLIDENNTGNAGASMFEVALESGASTGMRLADRPELWYFLAPAKLIEASACSTRVTPGRAEGVTTSVSACGGSVAMSFAAGDMVFVRKGDTREVKGDGAGTRAVVVVVPGGREGAARAGALPTPAADHAKEKALPVSLLAAKAKTFGPATIFLDDSIVKGTPMSAEILRLPAGAKVPEHVHANETELLYVLEGSGTMTIAGTDVPVTPTSVIQIPPNTKHAFVAKDAVRSLQIYTPAGPEQRFKKKP